ncbi:hypothetical protein FGADI_10275 [Fusarium gaditjirri]|uniref:Carbonic anhydrase n=1 Tax=Fusarium gaditjirri TaxID=282569 RepID=A0A8H4SY13_9HYPO|nr:hypothetical protein FGADI_10275 [Fusarium gaditjirri]
MAQRDVGEYLRQTHACIFENNKKWAEQQRANNPGFFDKISAGKSPEYLWIGCADSHIPAEQVTGLEPGKAFIHRNIANIAAMTPKDMGLLNPWLRNIRDVYRLYEKELDAITDEEQRYNRLQSYAKNSFPIVHGWVFNLHNGLLTDLKIDFPAMLKDVQKVYNITEE